MIRTLCLLFLSLVSHVSAQTYVPQTELMFSSSDSDVEPWEGGAMAAFWVTEHQAGQYRLYHSAASSEQAEDFQIGLATSSDGKTWTRDTANSPLLSMSGVSWRQVGVLEPCVIHLGPNDWRMWFTGQGATGKRRIGYATSPDGINWAANDYPIVLAGDKVDREWAKNAMVTWDGLQFEMWYTAYDGLRGRLGHAVSADGLQWSKHNLSDVTGDLSEPNHQIVYPFVRKGPVTDLLIAFGNFGGAGFDIYKYDQSGDTWTNPTLFWPRGAQGNPDDFYVTRPQIHGNKLYYMARSTGQTTYHGYMFAEEMTPSGGSTESFDGNGPPLGADLVWDSGNWSRVNGIAKRTNTGSGYDSIPQRIVGIASPVGDDSHSMQVIVNSLATATNDSHAGVLTNYDAASTTGFLAFIAGKKLTGAPEAESIHLGTITNGNWSRIGVAVPFDVSFPAELELRMLDNGDGTVDLEFWVNGQLGILEEDFPDLGPATGVAMYGRSSSYAGPAGNCEIESASFASLTE